jgi:hypothetical protein
MSAGGDLRQTWIDLCREAAVDPPELIDKKLDGLLKLILAASNMEVTVSRMLYEKD